MPRYDASLPKYVEPDAFTLTPIGAQANGKGAKAWEATNIAFQITTRAKTQADAIRQAVLLLKDRVNCMLENLEDKEEHKAMIADILASTPPDPEDDFLDEDGDDPEDTAKPAKPSRKPSPVKREGPTIIECIRTVLGATPMGPKEIADEINKRSIRKDVTRHMVSAVLQMETVRHPTTCGYVKVGRARYVLKPNG